MNDASDDTLTTLLQMVERDREERCARIREEAEEGSRALLREARAQARRRVTEAIREARQRARARVADARAALGTQARQRRQEASRSLLEGAWDALPEALADRWRTDDARRVWLEALIDLAATSLPLGTWQVTHPVDLGEDDARLVAKRIEEVTGEPPELVASDGVRAGLRVCVGATCLDATVRGLLADRRSVEGRLLAEMLREADTAREVSS